MHLTAARGILATLPTQSSRQVIFRDDGLIWAEHGDEVEQWNVVAASQGWGEITVRCDDGPDQEQRFFYTYKGEEKQCPVEFDRDDNLRSVHFIAEIVRADAELGACNDLVGNSESAFVALSPDQWKSLEAEFGPGAMAQRFTRVKGTFDEFCDEFFRDEHMPNYDEVDEEEPGPASIIDSGEVQRETPTSPTWQERGKEFAGKHWLTIAFFTLMLLVLIVGKK